MVLFSLQTGTTACVTFPFEQDEIRIAYELLRETPHGRPRNHEKQGGELGKSGGGGSNEITDREHLPRLYDALLGIR